MSLQSTGRSDDELALVVRPKVACAMLDISPPTFYQLINAGLLESYKEGAARKVTVASIRKYIANRIAKSKVPRAPSGRQRRGAALPTIPISTP
jgi:hypothetical protein